VLRGQPRKVVKLWSAPGDLLSLRVSQPSARGRGPWPSGAQHWHAGWSVAMRPTRGGLLLLRMLRPSASERGR
jgi:hypothetical protein